MRAADITTLATFGGDYGSEITAVATVLLSLVVAKLVDRAMNGRARHLGAAMAGREFSPEEQTRLRLLRRLVSATIIVLGVTLALAQFPSVQRVATGILASSAVLGLVVGFAARQTLANVIAGVLLAVTQPIRIGDLVTFEDETGEVEDVRLTYTYIRLDDGTRLIVPNERLAQSSLQNHTVVDPRVQVEVQLWIAPTGDAARALALLAADEGVEARVAAVEKDGVCLAVSTWADTARERGRVAARLREQGLQRLQSAALSSVEPA